MRHALRYAGLPRIVMALALAAAGPAPAAEPDGGCLRVKGWDTLPDIGRLCAYLADPDALEACERRGYRLGDRVKPEAAIAIQQYVLLCRDEYVIEVRRQAGEASLEISTAVLETRGPLQGEYDGGRVISLAGDGLVWRETAVARWSNWTDGHGEEPES